MIHYFLITFGATLGFLSPFVLLLLLATLFKLVTLAKEKCKAAQEAKTIAQLLESNKWVLDSLLQPPNPKMVTLNLRNYQTGHTFSPSFYKENFHV